MWGELTQRRGDFLTKRCLSQYRGFIADRIAKVEEFMRESAGNPASASADTEQAGLVLGKLFYHIWHKLADLDRVARGGEPKAIVR